MAMDERDLFADFIGRIRAGDDHAAKELVQQYEPIVRRELRFRMTDRRLRRAVDSDDLCQSIWSSFFLRTAAGQYDLETPGQLISLLTAMTKNKFASHSRKQHREKRNVDRLDADGNQVECLTDRGQDTPSGIVSGKELLKYMAGKLSVEELRMAELRRQGLTWAEVAERLGGTAQARRMQMDRAADRIARQTGIHD
jgi:DNA-directed RNA polymerase specialized sigma24 family protein